VKLVLYVLEASLLGHIVNAVFETICHCCIRSVEAQRDSALKLVSLIVSAYGINWLAAGNDETRLFPLLAVRLSCIEVQMMLEEQSYASVSSSCSCHLF